MTEITKIDHVETGLARMLSQWESSPLLKGLFTSFLRQCNTVEDVLFQLKEERGIYEAVGVQLDVIGALFKVSRNNLTDPQYRTEILRRITTSMGDGTTEVLMEGMRGLLATNFVDFFEHNSGDIHAWAGSGARVNTWLELQTMKAAGVNIRLYVDDEFDSFVMSEQLFETYNLETHTPDNVEVEIGSGTRLLEVQTGTVGTALADNAILPEIGDDTEEPYLAELLWAEVFTISGNIVDDLGNNIVDENGNNVIWIDYTY